jgi:hypothetical protein
MGSTRIRHHHLIYTWCHSRLRTTNPIKINENSHALDLSLSILILSLSTPNSVLILICCSSLSPTTIEGVLAGLSTLEHSNVLLPWRVPPGYGFIEFLRWPVNNLSDWLPIPVWPTDWFRGRSGSFAARARTCAAVCDQISHQQQS